MARPRIKIYRNGQPVGGANPHPDPDGFIDPSAPRCANPRCDNSVERGLSGRYLKYCSPRCAKQRWDADHRSAWARHAKTSENSRENSEISPEKILIQVSQAFDGLLTRIEKLSQLPLSFPTGDTSTRTRQSSGGPSDSELLAGLEATASKGNSDENPSYNIVLSLLGIGQKVEELPWEVVEYGFAKKKLSQSQVDAWHAANSLPDKLPSPFHGEGSGGGVNDQPGNPRPLANSDIQFTEANYDDIGL